MKFFRKRRRRRELFAQEVLPHLDTLYRFGVALTRDLNEADDLVQETILKALQSFESYEPGTNCRAWLLRIMRNTYINWVRAKGRETYLEDVGRSIESFASQGAGRTVAAKPVGPEAQMVLVSTGRHLLTALDSLPTEYRTAMVLVDVEGLSYKEAAEVMDVPIGTVMSRLYRARRLMRKRLVDMGVHESAQENAHEGHVIEFPRTSLQSGEEQDGLQDD